ncbi:hypothetical protein [Cellulomonas sp. NPDC089187]|uniref:hypothetical protein n=1 Tax=Cellulomonas sp. NPDC089187 TaxID=3154970 RepID=UPI00342E0D0C
MSADPIDWDLAWLTALDELELAADEAERLLAAAHLPMVEVPRWTPPAGLGALPLALKDRAEALLARQLDLARRTAAAAAMSRREAAVVQQITARAPAVPVYLDAEG